LVEAAVSYARRSSWKNAAINKGDLLSVGKWQIDRKADAILDAARLSGDTNEQLVPHPAILIVIQGSEHHAFIVGAVAPPRQMPRLLLGRFRTCPANPLSIYKPATSIAMRKSPALILL
jgi:hypothetical protein